MGAVTAVLTVSFILFLLTYFWQRRRTNVAKNCFRKMNCSGESLLPRLSEQEKYDIVTKSFHPSDASKKVDVIIIGSGLSGMTTAKILAAAGKRVLVLEQHDRAGGCCHSFELVRYEFDVGIHYVSSMERKDDMSRMFAALTDSEQKWSKMDDEFDCIMIEESSKYYARKPGDFRKFQKQLIEWFPEETANINEYSKIVTRCLKGLHWFFYLKLLPLPLVRFMLKTRLFRYFTSIGDIVEMNLQETMQKCGLSQELQTVIAYYFVNYGVPPHRSSFLQHTMFLMENGYYPIGGSREFVANIVRSIEALGGRVLVKANVKRIEFDQGRVSGVVVGYGRSEVFIPCSIVVSACSATKTFNELIPYSIAAKSPIFSVVDKVNQIESTRIAAFQAYIGLEGSQEELKLPNRNLFWFKKSDTSEIDRYIGMTVEDAINYGCQPFMYISFPSAKDPDWDKRSIQGTSTCQIISIANPDWFTEFKDTSKTKSLKRINKQQYLNLKNTLGGFLVENLMKVYPQVKDKIVFVEFSTPLTQQYYINNNYGELYGLSHQLERFKPEIWSELRSKTGLTGLYLTGQDTMFSGIVSALLAGFFTAGEIIGRNTLKDLKVVCNEKAWK